jgi:hypothetical protein
LKINRRFWEMFRLHFYRPAYAKLKTSMEQAAFSPHFDTFSRCFLTWFILRQRNWRRHSETSVHFQRATRFYVPISEERTLHNRSREDIKSCFVKCILYFEWTPLPFAGIYGDSPRTLDFNLIALSLLGSCVIRPLKRSRINPAVGRSWTRKIREFSVTKQASNILVSC